MKQLLPTQSRKGFAPLVLLGMLLTFQISRAQQQQQNINVNANVSGNQSLNNIRNINMVIPTQGPNGIGSLSLNNINVIDNGTGVITGGPNVRGYAPAVIAKQTVATQVANKPKTTKPAVVQTARPRPVVASSSTVQRPKPKPKATTATPRRTVVRPATPVVAAPIVAAPAAPQLQAPVSNPVIGTENEQVVVQQEVNDDNVILQSDAMSNVMSNAISNVRANVSAPATSAASSSAVRRSASSGGSASSGKSHRSGRKKHGSFGYNANKKLKKLFAQNRKGKFDPAKCFVWN